MAISNLVSQLGSSGNYSDWVSSFKPKTANIPAAGQSKYTPPATTKPLVGAVPPPPKPTATGAVAPSTISSGTQNQTYTAPGTSAGQPINLTTPAPQTGNVQTPSGATVNAASGALLTPPPSTASRGLFSDVATSLASRGSQTNPMTQESYQRAQQLAETLRQSRQNQSNSEAQQRLAPIPIGDATGRQAVIRQQYETQQAALSGQLQAEQALAGLGIQQAGVQQQALGTVAGLAPEATRFETFGGTSLSPQNRAQELAQQVRNQLISPQQAEDQMASLYGGAGKTFLNQALQGTGGYNYIAGAAQAVGQANVLGNLPALNSANTAAEGIKNTINSYLQANPTLNPSPLAAGNAFLQFVQGKQLSDPKYQTLVNYLNEYTSTLAPILGVGGTPTDFKTSIAQSFINAAASGASITEVLNNMSKLAEDKIKNIQSGATGGGVVSQTQTGGDVNFNW